MLKKLSQSLREYKKPAMLTPVFMIIEVLMEVLIPLLMATLIDKGIDMGNMSVVAKMSLILFGAALLSLFAGVYAGVLAARSSAGFAKNLRQDMFHNVQSFSFSNIDHFSSSSLITRLTTDVTNLQNSFQMLIRMASRAPMMLIFALIAAIRISPKLSIIFAITIPILAICLYLIMTRVHPIFTRVFRNYDELNNVVQENVSAIRVVKSFLRETFEISKFENQSNRIKTDFVKAEKLMALNMPLIQFLMYCTFIFLSWFGARSIIVGGNNPALGLTTGGLLSLIMYSMQILMSLMMLSMVFVMITISRASAERIIEVLDEDSDLSSGDANIMEVPDGSITFKNVSFSYSNTSLKPVLENINLSIKSGETIGILGGTGSSKSSLVQLIPRLYDTTLGDVLVGGHNVKDYNLEVLRDEVAMVLQKNVLFSGTIKENLLWGDATATDEEIIDVCKKAQAHKFIMEFPKGYDTHIEQGGTNVSGGQKQRLSIARALLKKPKIIIFDDSTSAVDTKTDYYIRQALIEDLPHTTKLIIAQRVDSVKDADHIIVMRDGHVYGYGSHDELLLNNDIYREVYESQTKGDEKSA